MTVALALRADSYAAHEAVRRAVKAGRLVRPASCSRCSERHYRIEAHHHQGYEPEHWLDVLWLCNRCHKQEHPKC